MTIRLAPVAALFLLAAWSPAVASAADGVARELLSGQAAPAPPAAAEPCRVFVTTDKVEPSRYRVLKPIKFSKKMYGRSAQAIEGMAREAWKVDADAVVDVDTSFRPSKFSWASPHATGTAVAWTDEGKRRFAELKGECFAKP